MEKTTYNDYALLDVDYHKNFLSDDEASNLLQTLLSTLTTKPNQRTNYTYGEKGLFYKVTFHGQTFTRYATEWTDELRKIKERLEDLLNQEFNYCVVQHYPHGSVGISPHRDKEMQSGTIIAGISLGSARKLIMGRQGKEIKIKLSHGSLYTFNPPTNDYWTHSIARDNQITQPRISLTYRLKE